MSNSSVTVPCSCSWKLKKVRGKLVGHGKNLSIWKCLWMRLFLLNKVFPWIYFSHCWMVIIGLFLNIYSRNIFLKNILFYIHMYPWIYCWIERILYECKLMDKNIVIKRHSSPFILFNNPMNIFVFFSSFSIPKSPESGRQW